MPAKKTEVLSNNKKVIRSGAPPGRPVTFLVCKRLADPPVGIAGGEAGGKAQEQLC